MIEVEIPIVGATIVSHPLIVRVNVRNFRMTCLVHGNAVPARAIGLLAWLVPGRAIGLLTARRGCGARRLGSPRRGSGTASGNVSTANRLGAAAAALVPAALLPTAPPILSKSSHANENGQPEYLLHTYLPGEISPIESVARDAPTQNRLIFCDKSYGEDW
jgi:hypothetical protein